MHTEYGNCQLCARNCAVNRNEGMVGYCKSTSEMKICRAALHFWEEPVISGENGSGTVFFSGCSMGCVFCQNREISRASVGRRIDCEELSEIMLKLEAEGAHNINFVTPTHFAPSIITTVKIVRENGLIIPIVYNTGGYDSLQTVKNLSETVNVYLPDFKYYRGETAKKYSQAENYPTVALQSIREMVRQRPVPVIKDGIMQEGVIIRILLLPGHVAEAKLSLGMLYREFGDNVFFSLMGQYTPMDGMKPPLDRPVTAAEYRELVDYACKIGIKNAFVQELSSANSAYIPDFNLK